MKAKFLIIVMVASFTSACKGWLDINDDDRNAVIQSLNGNVSRLQESLEQLEGTLDAQRAKLAADLQQTLAQTMTNLHGVVAQLKTAVDEMNVALTNVTEVVTADLGGSIASLTDTVEHMRLGVESQVAATIQQLNEKIEAQRVALLRQTAQVVQATIRPTLERLAQDGDYLVGKVASTANVLTVRLVGGAIALIGLIGLIIVLVKIKAPGSRWPAVGMTTIIFLVGLLSSTALAGPLARIGVSETRIPSGAKVCAETSELFVRFKASKTTALASELKASAIQCIVVAPTPVLAAQANDAFSEASAFMGERVTCTTHADCASQGKKCDAIIGECVDPSVYCETSNSCPSGSQCVSRRCVAIQDSTASCTTPVHCRAEQACNPATGRCEEISKFVPAPCTVQGVHGPCEAGATAIEDRWVRCKQTVQAAIEVCDGVDNNCNGTPDEGLNRPEHCIAPGAQGECAAQGTWTCNGAGGWSCTAAGPQAETSFGCDGKDNNCDGIIDNGVLSGGACSNSGAQGECNAHATLVCVGGVMRCMPAPKTDEICDGLDNNCDGIVDPAPVCGERVIRQQGPDDYNKDMTWSPRLPTDLIDGTKQHFGSCGTDEHGRPYTRTRAEVHAESKNGAICELAGIYNGFTNADPTDCQITVHYKTIRWGSNVWCSGTWYGVPTGPYRQ
jgi:hypothetical protein